MRCHATFGRRGGDEVNVVSRNEINDGVTVGEVRLRVEMGGEGRGKGGKVKILDFMMDKNTRKHAVQKKKKKRKKRKRKTKEKKEKET